MIGQSKYLTIQKELVTCFLAMFFCTISKAQVADTLFYDSKWGPSTKKNAAYYRPLPLKKVASRYQVRDYYLDGSLQMEGYSLKEDEDVFEGQVTYYFPNGAKNLVRTYRNGQLEGPVISFFSDGKKRAEGIFKDGAYWEGNFSSKHTGRFLVDRYKQGARVARFAYYADTKTVAEKQTIKYYDQVQMSIYYDTKGNELSRVRYKNRSGMYLEPLEGTFQYFETNQDDFVTRIIGTGAIAPSDSGIVLTTTLNRPKIRIKGMYKNGYPFEGQFYKEGSVYTLKNGKREGEEHCCYPKPAIQLRGINKDGHPFEGSFFKPGQRKVVRYKQGKLEGEQLTYSANLETVIEREEYAMGIKQGTFVTFNKYLGESIVCEYRDNEPYDGKIVSAHYEKEYAKGELTMETRYDEISHLPTEKTFYVPGEFGQQVAKVEQYREGKTYLLNYKDGSPFEGVKWEWYGYVTYGNGSYNGPYEVREKGMTERGIYKDFKREGKVFRILKDSTYVCTYKKNKPYSGTDYDSLSGEIVEYREGEKDGTYIKSKKGTEAYDKIVGKYKGGVPIGVFEVFKNGNLIDSGTYRNGAPYDGVFYDRENYQRFDKGQLLVSYEVAFSGSHSVYKRFKNGELVEERVHDKRNDDHYHLTYRNGSPYEGHHLSKNQDDGYTLTAYRNGRREGTQKTFTYAFRYVEQLAEYKDDRLHGTVISYLNNNEYSCSFHEGKPIDGDYVRSLAKKVKQLTTFAGGIPMSVRYFLGYNLEKQYYGSYKDGLPFEGLFVSLLNGVREVKEYANGRPIKTYLNGSNYSLTSGGTITHEKQRDIISNNSYRVVIDYRSNDKKTGKATFINTEGANLGSIRFKNHRITKAKVDFGGGAYDGTQLVFKDGLNARLHVYQQVYLNIPRQKDPEVPVAYLIVSPSAFSRPREDKPAEYRRTSDDKLLGTLFFKNKKPWTGMQIQKTYEEPEAIIVLKYLDGAEVSKEKMSLNAFLERY